MPAVMEAAFSAPPAKADLRVANQTPNGSCNCMQILLFADIVLFQA
jgi:hypothetical protein